jgi:hypothetical protein
MQAKRPILTILAACALALVALPGIVSAHETRTVAGKYKFVVGFLNEPAIVDQPNSIDLTVTDSSTGQPIMGLEKSLKAQIIFGGESENVTLEPRFNAPGKYNAYVIPTKSGTWKFHFTGKVNNDSIDELFTSGPNRFSDVGSAADLQFPAKSSTLVDLSAQSSAAQSSATSAQNSARTGMILGAIGVAVGAAGLIVGGLALAKARRERASAPAGVPERRSA